MGEPPKPIIGLVDRWRWLKSIRDNPALQPAALAVGFTLADHVNAVSGDAWPSTPTLMHLTRLGKTGVQKAVRQLVQEGHLHKTEHHGRGGSNRYRLIARDAEGQRPATERKVHHSEPLKVHHSEPLEARGEPLKVHSSEPLEVHYGGQERYTGVSPTNIETRSNRSDPSARRPKASVVIRQDHIFFRNDQQSFDELRVLLRTLARGTALAKDPNLTQVFETLASPETLMSPRTVKLAFADIGELSPGAIRRWKQAKGWIKEAGRKWLDTRGDELVDLPGGSATRHVLWQLINQYRRDPAARPWPAEDAGPAPGQPGCVLPADLFDEMDAWAVWAADRANY